MIIQRNISKTFVQYCDLFPVIAIFGLRQSGKTTFVKDFAKRNFKNYIYLDLEQPTDYYKLENAQFFFEQNKDKVIIIDEIHRRPELFGVIRSSVDKHQKSCRFIILGSASPELIKSSAESLAGRIGYIKLHPFSFTEIQQNYDFEKHFFYGGLPKAFLSKSNKAAKTWLDNFITSYIERDLPQLGLTAKSVIISKLLQLLAWQSANLINITAIAQSLGLSAKTVSSYLDFLEKSYLIKRLEPYFFNIKKRVVKTPKIFITDTGILHRLLAVSDYNQLLGTQLIGLSWETYVFNQIIAEKKSDTEIFFYRTHAGAELDLVLTQGLIPKAGIEIKFSEQPRLTKGFYSAIDTLKTGQNFVIIPNSGQDFNLDKNVIICGFDVFITKYLPNI